MNTSQILAALSTETDPAKQRVLVAQLREARLRAAQASQAQASRSTGRAYVADRLTPVHAHSHHTGETDWLGKVAADHDANEVHRQATAAATEWFRSVNASVRQHPGELSTQAQWYANRWGSQFGIESRVAVGSFLQRVSHLAGFKIAADDEEGGEENNATDSAMDEGNDDDPKNQSDKGWEDDEDAGSDEDDESEDSKKEGARKTAAEARPLWEIADEIRRDWKNVNFAAKPYLDAMSGMESINDMYGADEGRWIVAYFLSNASSWKGEVAKRIKAELKAMSNSRRGSRTAASDAPQVTPDENGEKTVRNGWVSVKGKGKVFNPEMAQLVINMAWADKGLLAEGAARIVFQDGEPTNWAGQKGGDDYVPLPWTVQNNAGEILGAYPTEERAQEEMDLYRWVDYDGRTKTFASRTAGADGLFSSSAPGYFKDDFTKLTESLAPFAQEGDDNGEKFSYIGGGAPPELVRAYQHATQMGYANGWLASLRPRTADQGFGPDADSQSGQAESQLPWVDVNADETFEMGWTQDGGGEDPDGADEMAPEGEIGPFDAARHTAKKVYVFQPIGMDLFDRRPHQPKPGTRVVLTQPGLGAPRNGTMGHVYVEDAETGQFYGLVLKNSLQPEGKTSARRTAVSLTNVGFEDGIGSNTAHGYTADGRKVVFRLSDQDAKDLAYVMTSDMAINFSGVDVDEADIISTASRKTAADGDTSFCRLCGRKLEQMEHIWYALSASPAQRPVGAHTCVPARLEGRSGEFGPDGVLVPGTPGGEGGQYDAPAGTIFDGGGNAIRISASRRTADQGFGPAADSQSGHAESALPDVTVADDDDTNLGWIEDGNGDYDGSMLDDEGRYGSRKTAVDVLRTTPDGKYRLTGPRDGYYWLESPDGEGGWYEVGAVMDPENFETAVDNAEEEMRVLLEEARMEFGASRRQAAQVERFDDGHSEWKCEKCGATVERWPGESDVWCASCDTPYNAFGQRLRDDWAGNPSNYDDDISDLDGFEMQQSRYESSLRIKADAPFAGSEDGSKPAGAAPQVEDVVDEAMFEADEVKDFTGPEGAAANLSFAPPFTARRKPTINDDELGIW